MPRRAPRRRPDGAVAKIGVVRQHSPAIWFINILIPIPIRPCYRQLVSKQRFLLKNGSTWF
jgi:hypothetical protein